MQLSAGLGDLSVDEGYIGGSWRKKIKYCVFSVERSAGNSQIANTRTGLMTKIMIFNLAFMLRISSSGHISMPQTPSGKEMLTLKQK